MAGWGAKIPIPWQYSLPSPPEWHALPHSESLTCSLQATSTSIHQGPAPGPCILKPCLPLKDLCHLVLVEDEAGVIVPQDSHDAQAQAGGVAAHQIRGFEKQLGLNYTQFIQ